jgi:hypothetical protein
MTMTLLIYIWVFAKGYILVPVIVCKVISALYFRKLGLPHWWLAFIPLCHLYIKWEVLGTNLVPLIAQAVLTVLFLTSFNALGWAVILALNIYNNYQFASYGLYEEALPYAVIPFGKYYIMVKEVIKREDTESR